jgi:hypothetical protein
MARAGVGTWTYVDKDYMLPHNLARHALDGFAVGMSKAWCLAETVKKILGTKNFAAAISADVLHPGKQAGALKQAYEEASVILDMSASVPVARHLARNVESNARRISIFLNPNGTDLVVLAEDKARSIPLDALEMQLYRSVSSDAALVDHLSLSKERLRYGRSCRDVSTRLAQHLVASHSGTASCVFQRLLQDDNASIQVWRANVDTLETTRVDIVPSGIATEHIGDWDLIVDATLLAKLADLRKRGLPAETGGVLIGAFDLDRKIAYVVDTVPSPPDSKEWPTLYIRGCRGLAKQVGDIASKTDGMLQYVGEWHSHPDGRGVGPSPDDLKVFSWLTEHMSVAGLPAMMFIVGEAKIGKYLGRIIPV